MLEVISLFRSVQLIKGLNNILPLPYTRGHPNERDVKQKRNMSANIQAQIFVFQGLRMYSQCIQVSWRFSKSE